MTLPALTPASRPRLHDFEPPALVFATVKIRPDVRGNKLAGLRPLGNAPKRVGHLDMSPRFARLLCVSIKPPSQSSISIINPTCYPTRRLLSFTASMPSFRGR